MLRFSLSLVLYLRHHLWLFSGGALVDISCGGVLRIPRALDKPSKIAFIPKIHDFQNQSAQLVPWGQKSSYRRMKSKQDCDWTGILCASRHLLFCFSWFICVLCKMQVDVIMNNTTNWLFCQAESWRELLSLLSEQECQCRATFESMLVNKYAVALIKADCCCFRKSV